MRTLEPSGLPMYERTVGLLNTLAVLGVIGSVAMPVFVFIVDRAEAPPLAYPFMLAAGLTGSLVLRALAILVHVSADTRRRVAEAAGR